MMANNSNPQDNLDYIYDLLSAYLDGEVTEAERALIEQALATSPELQQELNSLRQTVTLVRALPQVSAPRPFTLSQADIQPAAPAPQKSLWRMPAWAGSLALLATALVCVLVAGTLFWGTQQFNQPASAPAEIAQSQQLETSVANESTPQEESAAMAELRVETEAEEAAAEESAPEMEMAQEAPVEAAEAADEASIEEEVEAEEAAKESAGDTAQKVAEQDDLDAGGGAADQIAGAVQATTLPLVTATPPPLPSPTQQLAAAAESAEEETQPVEPPIVSEPATGEGADAEAPPEDNFYRDTNARPVEIQNQRLQIQPGLIDLEGILDTPSGTQLQASLLRNGQLFDEWANPTTLQSVVQENGQFSFAIQADATRSDADLFAEEAANYQLTIIAPASDPPIVANIFFDTFGRAAAPEQQTADSSTPTPRTTLNVTPTVQPSPTPVAADTVTSQTIVTPQPVQQTDQVSLGKLNVLIGIIVVMIVIIAGLIIWFNMNRKS